MDDVILANDSLDAIASVKTFLYDTFQIKDLGQLCYFLGLEVARLSAGINLNQCKYAIDLLTNTGFLNAKPATTPMASTSKFSLHDSPLLLDNS